jgi:DNA repair protein RadC
MTTYRIRDLYESERPRERLANAGVDSLSEIELLAILLRTGIKGENAIQMANRLLITFNGLRGLYTASYEQLRDQKGMGSAKAAQIKAALELGKRLQSNPSGIEQDNLNSPKKAADLVLYEMSPLAQEELWVIILNTRNQVLKIIHQYKGTVNQSNVRIGELFKEAIQMNGVSIILAHNHPSGDPQPSSEDILLTRDVMRAGKLLNIELLDHLIIGNFTFLSLKEKGLGFNQPV